MVYTYNMKYKIFLLSFSFFFLQSCVQKKITSSAKTNAKTEAAAVNYITITSKNLTEDVSIVSTKNDELIFLIYAKPDKQYPELVASAYFVMDKINTPRKFKINNKIDLKEDLVLVLLEIDTKQNIKQIEPIVRLNLNSILTNFAKEDLKKIKELLGDDDIITIQKANFKTFIDKGVIVQGTHLFDAYEYIIKMEHK